MIVPLLILVIAATVDLRPPRDYGQILPAEKHNVTTTTSRPNRHRDRNQNNKNNDRDRYNNNNDRDQKIKKKISLMKRMGSIIILKSAHVLSFHCLKSFKIINNNHLKTSG